jgi:hypothetical protein
MKDTQETSKTFQRSKLARGMKEGKGFSFWEEFQPTNKSPYPPYPMGINFQAICRLTIKEIL